MDVPLVDYRQGTSQVALHTLCEGVRGREPIRSESGDGAVEELEAQFIKHYASDIDATGCTLLSSAWRIRIRRRHACYASPLVNTLEDTQGESTQKETRRGTHNPKPVSKSCWAVAGLLEVAEIVLHYMNVPGVMHVPRGIMLLGDAAGRLLCWRMVPSGGGYRHFDPVNHRYASTQPPEIVSDHRPDGPEFREGASPRNCGLCGISVYS